MKLHSLPAIASSLLLMMTVCGCSNPNDRGNDSAGQDALQTERFDISAYQKKIENLNAIWSQPGHAEEIRRTLTELLETVDKVYADYARSEIRYYSDWNNERLTAERDAAYTDFSIATDMTRWAFFNGSKRSAYHDLFAEYDLNCAPDYYLHYNLVRIIAYAKQDAAEDTALLDQYYDAAYSGTTDPAVRNTECAQLYLDILNSMSESDYDYESYCRDYTEADVTAVYEELAESFLPLYQTLGDSLEAGERDIASPGDALQLLQQNAAKLSPEIKESADLLVRDGLCTSVSGSDCYDGSYTVFLPNEQTALMYLYQDGTFLDFTTAVHEFGHFHSERLNQTPVLLQKNCIDIAEVHSQGMEMLFTEFYRDIFGNDAKTAELVALYNLTDAVMSGFAVGRFEAAVMDQKDSLMPEDVLALYERYCGAFGIGLEFYEISHLFEQPGYYISYGVSALPALELYVMSLEDPDDALTHYEKISAVSDVSGDVRFREAMKNCAMTDYFERGNVTALADQLLERVLALIS